MNKLLMSTMLFSVLALAAQAGNAGIRALTGEKRIETLQSVDMSGAEIFGTYTIQKADGIGEIFTRGEMRFLNGSEHSLDMRDNRFMIEAGISRQIVDGGILSVSPLGIIYETAKMSSIFNTLSENRWFYAPSITYKHTIGDFSVKADASYRMSISNKVNYATVSGDVYNKGTATGYDIGVEAAYSLNKNIDVSVNWSRENLNVPGDGNYDAYNQAQHYLGAGISYNF